MNYYPFHIGDYLSATRHLSWDEDCAYRRLLDIYYTNEKPLPLDVAKVCRLAVASTDTQRAAVEAVLREFFVETPEGWTQKRIEDELAEMHMRQEAQEEREEGKQTRLQRFRLQRAEMFQALREVGIVAAWNIKMPELRQLWEQNKHRFPAPETPKNVSGAPYEETAPETAPETTTNASATTLPIPTPIPTPKKNVVSPLAPPADRGTRLAADWHLPDDWRLWCIEHRPDLNVDEVAEQFRDFWVAKPGKDGRKADWLATWRNWCRSQKSGPSRKPGSADDWTARAH